LPPRNPFSCNTLPHHHHTTRVKNPFTFLDSLHNPLLLKRKHDDDDDDDDDNNNNDNDNNSNSSRDRDRDHDYDHGSTSDESMEAALPSEDDDYDIEDVCSNHSRRRAPVGLAFDAYQDKQDTWPDEEVNVDNQAEEIGHDSDQGRDVKRKNKTLLKLLQKPKPTLGSQNTSEDLLDLEWLSIGSSTSSEPITKTKVCPPGSSVAHCKPTFLATIDIRLYQGSQDPPFDWSLKLSASFTSPSPFTWCSTAAITSQQESRALVEFVRRPCDPDGEPVVKQDVDDTNPIPFQAHLYHWIYPSTSPSPMQVVAITKLLSKVSVTRSEEVVELEHFKKIEAEWYELNAVLYGEIFPVALLPSPRSPLRLLLLYWLYLYRPVSVRQHVRYWTARSHIPFEMPLNRFAKNDLDSDAGMMDVNGDDGDDAPAELEKLEELNPGSTFIHVDYGGFSLPSVSWLLNSHVVRRDTNTGDKRRSVLMFRAHMGVHGLFNFLLNWRDNRVEFRARGPPTLVAPCTFLNAAVKQAEITRNGTIRRMTTDPSTARPTMRTLYRIDIEGYLLPTSLHNLLLTVGYAQGPGERFACAMKTDERTSGLNVGEYGAGGKEGWGDGEEFGGDSKRGVHGAIGSRKGWNEVVRQRRVKVVISGTGLSGTAVLGRSEVIVVRCADGWFEWN
ncbi:hypothetical protein BC938DRAFT_474312, partial [Jimgerdemannia flammicorona]